MDSATRKKALYAGTIGNVIEWYDFVLYGYFATTIAQLFFPREDPTAALLSTFVVFAVGFLSRPVGAVIFGHLTDRVGRRTSLIASVGLISAATIAMGLLPGYATLGVVAPILLLVLRCIQGVAAGGEYTGALTYVLEHAPRPKRGRFAGVAVAGSYGGFALGSLACIAMTSLTTPEQLLAWGWRVPFLAAAPLAIVGLILRLRVEDSPVFQAMLNTGDVEHAPLKQAFKTAKLPMLIMIAWASACSVGYFLSVTFLISYLNSVRHFTPTQSLGIGVATSLVALAVNLIAGPLIDKVGQKRVAVTSAAVMGVWAIPAFLLFEQASILASILIVTVFAVCLGANAVITGLACVQLFPAQVRGTASAISYNIAYGVIGGTAPLLATWLSSSGSLLVPGIYLAVVSAIALVAAAVAIGTPSYDHLSDDLTEHASDEHRGDVQGATSR